MLEIDAIAKDHPAPWTVPVEIELQQKRAYVQDAKGNLLLLNGSAIASMFNAYAAQRARLEGLIEFLIESHERADDDWGAVYYGGRDLNDAIEAAKGDK